MPAPQSQHDGSCENALNKARRLAGEGRFEEALQHHVWFHNHVLDENPSYYGVRLSFALSAWVELGRQYPKALQTLKSIRDSKTSRLIRGEQARSLFHDVKSINHYLEEGGRTVELFKYLSEFSAEFAAEVYDFAQEDLVAAGEFRLAGKYLADPFDHLSRERDLFEWGIKHAKSIQRQEECRQAYEKIFADEVIKLIIILRNTSDSDTAQKIQSEALKVLDTHAIREALPGSKPGSR